MVSARAAQVTRSSQVKSIPTISTKVQDLDLIGYHLRIQNISIFIYHVVTRVEVVRCGSFLLILLLFIDLACTRHA